MSGMSGINLNELLESLEHDEEIRLSRSHDSVTLRFSKIATDGRRFTDSETMTDLYMHHASESVDVVYAELNRIINSVRKASHISPETPTPSTSRPSAP